MKTAKVKKVSASTINKCPREIFPNNLNSQGTVFGGYILLEADKIAGHVAKMHSGKMCVTLSMDEVRFLAPAYLGETLLFDASPNRVWNTSMEIGVKVWAKNFRTDKLRHIVSLYTTFVALDENEERAKIPEVIPVTPAQKRRYAEADARRKQRLEKEKARSK